MILFLLYLVFITNAYDNTTKYRSKQLCVQLIAKRSSAAQCSAVQWLDEDRGRVTNGVVLGSKSWLENPDQRCSRLSWGWNWQTEVGLLILIWKLLDGGCLTIMILNPETIIQRKLVDRCCTPSSPSLKPSSPWDCVRGGRHRLPVIPIIPSSCPSIESSHCYHEGAQQWKLQIATQWWPLSP